MRRVWVARDADTDLAIFMKRPTNCGGTWLTPAHGPLVTTGPGLEIPRDWFPEIPPGCIAVGALTIGTGETTIHATESHYVSPVDSVRHDLGPTIPEGARLDSILISIGTEFKNE